MEVLAQLLPPLAVVKSTAFPPEQSFAVTQPWPGSKKKACIRRRSGGNPPGTLCIGVMSAQVFPESSVATRRWWHLDGSVARQRRTMATPNDLDTSWNAWTLIVLACEPGDSETDGGELTTGGDERAD
jgi:hypothetical protein